MNDAGKRLIARLENLVALTSNGLAKSAWHPR